MDSPGKVKVFAFSEGQNYQKVLDRFYEVTKDTLQTKLTFSFSDDIKKEQLLQLSSKEDFDLIFDAFWLNASKNLENGMYADLTDYFNNPDYPGLQAAFPEELLDSLKYTDGRKNPKKRPVPGGIAPAVLTEQYSLPVIEHEDMPVKEVIFTPAGETVLDFGQNFAGYVTFRGNLPKGTKVVLDFGEILQKGNFYNANYRRAKSQFTYISGRQEELVKPQFTYFGFRYVRVTGWKGELDPSDFMGRALYSDMEVTGRIETGNRKVNQLFSNVMWGQKSNSVDFPTDCPQRDERLGWTGDAQVFAGTASYNMDTSAFYNKFIHDLRMEQKKLDGILPGVIPLGR